MSANEQQAFTFMRDTTLDKLVLSKAWEEAPPYEIMSYEEYMERILRDMKREAQQYFDEWEAARDEVRALQGLVVALTKEVEDLKMEREVLKSKLATMHRTMEVTRSCD